MDVALVEHAEDDVDGHERGERRAAARSRREAWNAWAVPWKLPRMRRGHADLARGRLDALDRVAERRPGHEVEGQRHRRELRLVVHGERRRPVA